MRHTLRVLGLELPPVTTPGMRAAKAIALIAVLGLAACDGGAATMQVSGHDIPTCASLIGRTDIDTADLAGELTCIEDNGVTALGVATMECPDGKHAWNDGVYWNGHEVRPPLAKGFSFEDVCR